MNRSQGMLKVQTSSNERVTADFFSFLSNGHPNLVVLKNEMSGRFAVYDVPPDAAPAIVYAGAHLDGVAQRAIALMDKNHRQMSPEQRAGEVEAKERAYRKSEFRGETKELMRSWVKRVRRDWNGKP